jgi:dolichol-phosphate mannosyltransferase
MLQLAVILPTYNESKNIASMVERLDKALAGIAWEAIFVDDNSPDGTADVARAIGRSDPRIRVIERIGRRGLASAAIEGMCATAAPIVAVMDSDHQHDPALLPPMLAAITSGNATWPMPRALPKGQHRSLGPARPGQGLGLANAIARKVTGVQLSDPMSGFFMLPATVLRADAHRLSGVGFKILLDILATVDAPLRVKEFPLNFAARAEGDRNWIVPSCLNSSSAFTTSGLAASSPPALPCSARSGRWARWCTWPCSMSCCTCSAGNWRSATIPRKPRSSSARRLPR